MDVCEALSLTCVLHRDDAIISLRKKLKAAHTRNYRLRKNAQQSAAVLEVEQRARSILKEILVLSIRRTDLLESLARTADV